MGKNSFFLIETLVALLIVSFILTSFTKVLENTKENTLYNNLQSIQNNLILNKKIQNNSSDFTFVQH